MERETRLSHLILAQVPGQLGCYLVLKTRELMQAGACTGPHAEAMQDVILSILKEATVNQSVMEAMRNASQFFILRDE